MSLMRRILILTSLPALAAGVDAAAETYDLKVVYGQVPGIQKILSGQLQQAIRILEDRRNDAQDDYVIDELATLCALYIVEGRLDAAKPTCRAAVRTDRSYAAYNNRGVLRAHLGDMDGALHDFDRARVPPDEEDQYVEQLMRSDARFMASSNFLVARKIVERRSRVTRTMRRNSTAAEIEQFDDPAPAPPR